MRWVGTASMLVLAGCQIVFPLDGPPDDGGGSAAPDAPRDGLLPLPDGLVPDGLLGLCPTTYTITLGTTSRYRLATSNRTWLDAVTDCIDDKVAGSSRSTHLIVIADDPELMALVSAIGTAEPSVWIGLSDRITEGVYRTVSTETVAFPADNTKGGGSAPWGTGQPDDGNGNGTQDGVRVFGTTAMFPGSYDDDFETVQQAFVCECDDFAPNPDNYMPNAAAPGDPAFSK